MKTEAGAVDCLDRPLEAVTNDRLRSGLSRRALILDANASDGEQ
jgi:hypothetical protein